MNIRTLTAFLAAVLMASAANAEMSPKFTVAKVLNAPVQSVKGPADLKGKVVFLDFWATWCPPCVASLPHINKLAEKFKGEPVVFLTITDEAPEKIEAFMKTHEMKTWVGIDVAGSSLAAFKVKSRPDGYLIGKDGALLARISPEFVDEGEIRAALSGSFRPQPIERDEPAKAAAKSSADPYLALRIGPAEGKMRMSSGGGELTMQSVGLRQALAWIWDVDNSQVILDTMPVASLNITMDAAPKDFERAREVLKSAIQSAFHMKAVIVQQEGDVLLLKRIEGGAGPAAAAPEAREGLMAYGGGRLLGAERMPRIAKALWMSLRTPVIDETGLGGVYQFDMKWNSGDRAGLDKLLAEQGLRLEAARRPVDMLRVSPE